MRFVLLGLLIAGGAAPGAQEPPANLDQLLAAARASYARADYAAARETLTRAWPLAEETPADDPRRYENLKLLSTVLAASGQYADAEVKLQQAIEWRRAVQGDDHPDLIPDFTDLAMLCRTLGDAPRGLAILQDVRSRLLRTGGFDNPLLADNSSRMALLHLSMKELDRAVFALLGAIRIRETALGAHHYSLLPDLDRLASTLIVLRRYDEAEQTYRRALVIRERALGRADPELLPNIDGLAYSLFGQKKFAEAEPFYQRLLNLWEQTAGSTHPMVALVLDKLTVFYREAERPEDARAAALRANSIRALFHATGLVREAGNVMSAGDLREAARLYRKALGVLDASDADHAEMHKQIQESLAELTQVKTAPRAPKSGPKKNPSP